jgi:RNase H-fold protein (predicted Holliday junction resolvase)
LPPATCSLRTATPQATISAEGSDARLKAVEARIKEWQPDALVVGVPFIPTAPATTIPCARRSSPASFGALRPAGL